MKNTNSIKSLSELKGYFLKLSESEDPAYMKEKIKQDKISNAVENNLNLDEAETNSDNDTKSPDKVALKSGKITVDQIVDKLNTIRSGKSFKDQTIKSSLEQYIQSLKTPEKIALFAFLKGVAQIVTGEITGKEALEPSDPIPSVQMKKSVYKKTIKPTIVKKTSNKTSDKEDTSAPVPIKPKG